MWIRYLLSDVSRVSVNYPRGRWVWIIKHIKSMVLILRGGVSQRVRENDYLGQDSGFLKEINPGGDETCLIFDSQEKPSHHPGWQSVSPYVFPPAPQVPEMRAHAWESRGHRDRATVLCGVTIKRRKAIDIHHGRLGKLREAASAEMGRD